MRAHRVTFKDQFLAISLLMPFVCNSGACAKTLEVSTENHLPAKEAPATTAEMVPPTVVPLVAPRAADTPDSQPAAAPAEPLRETAVVPMTPSLIIIDNDEADTQDQIEKTVQWHEIPDAPGKTAITAGARFPVRVVSELNSKTAKVGDPVEAQVQVDIKIGGKLIAAKGSKVIGHVSEVAPARRMLVAEVSPHRWWRANGSIGVQFDQIINADGEHIPLNAMPAQQARIVVNKNEGRVMGVNHKGEIASPLSIQLKEQAIHYAIRGAASAGGVFSMGAVPVAYAVLGAISPSFAFMHPVGQNVAHRRLKGAAMGFVNGLPGGFLISDSIIKGAEASIKPGDQFLVELKRTFDGQPSTDAEMLAGGSKSVHGEIVGRKKHGAKNIKQPSAPVGEQKT